jgi:dUTPase
MARKQPSYTDRDLLIAPFDSSIDIRTPFRASKGAAGFDIYSIEPIVVKVGKRAVVPTNITQRPPIGTFAHAMGRSGLFLNHGITTEGEDNTISYCYNNFNKTDYV